MRAITRIVLVLLVAALPAGGCDKGLKVFTEEEPIAPTVIRGGGILAQILQTLGQSIAQDISFAVAAQAEKQGELIRIHMDRFGLRTLLDAPGDQTESALTDEGLVSTCRAGQPPISWIHSVEITIERAGDPQSVRRLAYYDIPPGAEGDPNLCGFFLTVEDSLNINDFFPDFVVGATVRGEAPAQDTTVGGFYRASAYIKL